MKNRTLTIFAIAALAVVGTVIGFTQANAAKYHSSNSFYLQTCDKHHCWRYQRGEDERNQKAYARATVKDIKAGKDGRWKYYDWYADQHREGDLPRLGR